MWQTNVVRIVRKNRIWAMGAIYEEEIDAYDCTSSRIWMIAI